MENDNVAREHQRPEPIIGIIVPAFRCERFLGETLRSIAAQTFRRWECIIVDDGSPDATAKVAEEFAHQDGRFRIVRQKNSGVAKARNHGIQLLSRSVFYVVCMDADDVYEPHALELLKSELDKHPEAVGANALAEFIDESSKAILPGEFPLLGRSRIISTGGRIRPLSPNEPTTFASIFTSSTIFPPGLLLIRRNVIDQVGGYDPSISPADDWDYVIRICRHGTVRFLDHIILQYRRHSSNQGAGLTVPEMCRRVRHKNFFSPENSEEHRRIVRESWRACQVELAKLRFREASQHLKHFRLIKSLLGFSRLPFIGYRYLRGYPTLGWL
jgi:glycosyltransferase involved in cell wall biosynthesis